MIFKNGISFRKHALFKLKKNFKSINKIQFMYMLEKLK